MDKANRIAVDADNEYGDYADVGIYEDDDGNESN